MLSKVVAMFVVLAFTVFSVTAMAHAGTMSSATDHAAHANLMEQHRAAMDHGCSIGKPCASTCGEMCALVCAGLAGFLPPVTEVWVQVVVAADHPVAIVTNAAGSSPGPTERPPKLRLL